MLNQFSDQHNVIHQDQNDLVLKSGSCLVEPPEFSIHPQPAQPGKQDGQPLVYLRPSTVTNLSLLMKKFEESDLTNHNIETSDLLQDAGGVPGASIRMEPGLSCPRLEDSLVLDHGGIGEGGSELHLAAQDLMFYSDVKKACYLAPTPPASDYDDLCLSDASPAGPALHHGDMSAPDLLSPPLSIRSGLEFQESPRILHYPSPSSSHSPHYPSSSHSPHYPSPSSSHSPNSTMTMSPSPMLASPGGDLSYASSSGDLSYALPNGELNYAGCSSASFSLSPLSNNSGSPLPGDQINHQQGCIPDSDSTSFVTSANTSSADSTLSFHHHHATSSSAFTASSSCISSTYPSTTTVFSSSSTSSDPSLVTSPSDATISFIPTSATDEINAINIIELSLLKGNRLGKRSISISSQPMESQCNSLQTNNKNIIAEVNQVTFKDNKIIKQEPMCKLCTSSFCSCSMSPEQITKKGKYEEGLMVNLPKIPDNTRQNSITEENEVLCIGEITTNTEGSNTGTFCSTKVVVSTSDCTDNITAVCTVNSTAVSTSSTVPPTDGVVKEASGGCGDSLDDIPTLSDLAKQSPKLSTWRLTRIVSEKLEQHLWIWRCACKKSGKRISKSLLQARAKWAFRKAGIIEFKASDGWYWKWLAKWRRKGEEIGVKEQGQLTQQELKILPAYSYPGTPGPANHQTPIKTEGIVEKGVVCECRMDEDLVESKLKTNINSGKLQETAGCTSDVRAEKPGTGEGSFPNQIIPVHDILPLTLSGDEITLGHNPIESSLPVSPIFIRNGHQNEPSNDLLGEYSSVVEGLEAEFPNLNCEYLNLDSLCNWQPCDMDDIDTDTLVRSLSSQSKPCMASLATSLSTSLSASCIKPEADKSNKLHETDSSGNSSNCFLGDSGVSDSRSRLPDNQQFLQHKIKTETCDTDIKMGVVDDCSMLPSCCSSFNSSSLSACNSIYASSASLGLSLCSSSSNIRGSTNVLTNQTAAFNSQGSNSCPLTSSATGGTTMISKTGSSVSGCSSNINSPCFGNTAVSCGDISCTQVSCGTTSISPSPAVVCGVTSLQEPEPAQDICGANCRRLKQSPVDRIPVPGEVCVGGPSSSTPQPSNKPVLTTIAIYKKRGEESLNKFKDEVRKYAVDHTFKETAKRFGIHHSTVSGWVKESEKLDKSSTQNSFFKERGDEKFIHWLREYRYQNKPVTLTAVKNKVADILMEYTVTEVEKTCKWFLLWHNRREERLYVEGMEDEDMKKETQNLAYPPAFKLEVALFAKKHSQYAAAKIFNVARRRIFDWMRQIPKLEELIAKGHMKKMTGRGPKNRDIDQALYSWYCDRKARGNRPKSCHVQSKARELYLTYGYRDMKCSYGWFKRWSQRFQIQLRYSYDDEILEWIMSRFDENKSVTAHELQTYGLSLIQREDPGFKASSGWALRFCKRHKEYMDSDTSFTNSLPQHLDSRVKTFRRVLHQLQQEKRFAYSSIGSVDELTINFNSILEKRPGCLLKYTGLDTADICIILSVMADGTLLNPMLIFKSDSDLSCDTKLLGVGEAEGMTQASEISEKGSVIVVEKGRPSAAMSALPHHINADPGSILSQGLDPQSSPLLTPLEFSVWLERVWFKAATTPSFLLADSYSVHTAELTKKLVLKEDSVLAIIPRACSSKLQPLHQGIKIKFRTHLEEMFLSTVKTSIGKGEGKPSPGKDMIIEWVQQAFDAIKDDKEEIIRSFKRADIFHT